MTAGEARGRVALARRALSRALRALSVPRPDWPSARAWLRLAAEASASLAGDCDDEGSAMATDDQRREAAERLRGAKVYTIVGKRTDGLTPEWNVALMSELADAVGLEGAAGIEVFERLADLIEPVRDKGEKDFQPDVTCDCEALLALADEMSVDGMDGFVKSLASYARRIREACGVVA